MENGVLLELLLVNAELLHNLLELAVDNLLLFLSHLDNNLFVFLIVIYDFASFRDKRFLFVGEFGLSMIRADLKDLYKLLELNVATSVPL